MNKAELIKALEPYPDDSEMWFESEYSIFPITGVEGQPNNTLHLTTNED